MDTIKINKGTTKLIAHRGVSGLEQENTVASFLLASYKTYFGIETDVHVTKDNKFIICHDDNIKRVTGINKVIEESTYDELKRIKEECGCYCSILGDGYQFIVLFYDPTYLFLSDLENPENFCIRKLVIENDEEYIIGLETEEEFDKILNLFMQKYTN